MSERYGSFDDALDAAIDAMRDGQPLSVILASHPAHAANLLPLLEIALSADAAAGAAGVPPSSRLIENYSVVRAAVRRARMVLPAEQPASLARPWWQRRLAFASLSLPAGAVAAIVITGASGAAAATVAAARTDIPARVAEAVRSSWVGDLLTGADPSLHSGPTNAAPPATRAAANSTFAASETSTPHAERTRTALTISGVVSDVHGNTFALTAGDTSWKVAIDGATRISGTITAGAAATATGSVSAGATLHADSVDVADGTGATPADPGSDADPRKTPDPPSGHTPGPPPDHTPGPPPGHTPGPPADHTPGPPPGHTPGPPADHTPGPPADRTPGPPPGHTPGPPADHTPPGQGNGNGGGNGQKP